MVTMVSGIKFKKFSELKYCIVWKIEKLPQYWCID